MSESGAIASALRALKRGIIDFRFDYPLEIVPNSGLKTSLAYYLYGDKLSWEAMRLDSQGIPQAWYRVTGTAYWPGYVAWYGLVHLGHYLRTGNTKELDIFVKQVNWLEKHAVTQSNGAVVWPMNFDYPVGTRLLKSPWISAHSQGLAISALVRGWRVTRNQNLLDLLERSSQVYEQDHRASGIRIPLDEGALYTEVPGGPKPGILDGFLTSLLGLHDLFVETGSSRVKQLFLDGLAGLKISLHEWDYRGKWSWYGCSGHLCSPAYHCLNRLLLIVLADITEDQELASYGEKWNASRLTLFERTEIYLVYNWTQNMDRVRHRTWRQLQAAVTTGRR